MGQRDNDEISQPRGFKRRESLPGRFSKVAFPFRANFLTIPPQICVLFTYLFSSLSLFSVFYAFVSLRLENINIIRRLKLDFSSRVWNVFFFFLDTFRRSEAYRACNN